MEINLVVWWWRKSNQICTREIVPTISTHEIWKEKCPLPTQPVSNHDCIHVALSRYIPQHRGNTGNISLCRCRQSCINSNSSTWVSCSRFFLRKERSSNEPHPDWPTVISVHVMLTVWVLFPSEQCQKCWRSMQQPECLFSGVCALKDCLP